MANMCNLDNKTNKSTSSIHSYRRDRMYYVLARDSKGNVSVMGEHVDEDDAREHEEQLFNAYPNHHIWTSRSIEEWES